MKDLVFFINHVKNVYEWMRRGWPLFVMALVVMVFFLCYFFLPQHRVSVNKWGSFLIKLGSIGFVLKSIEENFSVFGGLPASQAWKNYLANFPLGSGRVISLKILLQARAEGSVIGTVCAGGEASLEERIEELERRLQNMGRNSQVNMIVINQRLSQLEQRISENVSQERRRVDGKFAFLADFRNGLFGVLLALFGEAIAVLPA